MALQNVRLPSGEVVQVNFTPEETAEILALPSSRDRGQFGTPRNVKAAEIAVDQGRLAPELLGTERIPVGPSPGLAGQQAGGRLQDLAMTTLAQTGIAARNVGRAVGFGDEEQVLQENVEARRFIEDINRPGFDLADIGRVAPEAALIAGTAGAATIPRLTAASAGVGGLTADPGETLAGVAFGAAGGAGGGILGSIVGRLIEAVPRALGAFGISNNVRNLIQGEAGAARSASARVLQREGLRPTPAEATGQEALRGIEAGLARRPSTAPAALRVSAERQVALNRSAARAIGEDAGTLDAQTLGSAAKRIGKVFDDNTPETVILSREAQSQLSALPDTVANRNVSAALRDEVDNILSTVGRQAGDEVTAAGRLTGEEFTSIRSQLVEAFSDASRTQGQGQLANRLRQAIDVLDDELVTSATAAGIEGAGPALQAAREQFKLLRLFETRGAAVTQGGNVNVTSMIRALESPQGLGTTATRGLERERLSSQGADFVELTRALSDREFVSIIPNSGTPTGQFIGELIQADASGLVREAVAAGVARTFFGESAVPGAFVGGLVRPFAESAAIQTGRRVGAATAGQLRQGNVSEQGPDILSDILDRIIP